MIPRQEARGGVVTHEVGKFDVLVGVNQHFQVEYHTMDISTRVNAGQCFFSPRNVSASVKKKIRQLDEKMRKHTDKNPNIPLKIVLIKGVFIDIFFLLKVLDILGRDNVICAKNKLFVWYRTG